MKNSDAAAVRYACYTANASMSVVAALSPLLFLTFRSLYGLSFSQLGALVLVNFCTQLAVDLLLSFYSQRFCIAALIKAMPALTALGLFVYAAVPFAFPGAVYAGLMTGTVIFSASAGLAKVLISPVIAALPAKNPAREMSMLHSIYAWGVVAVVVLSTGFLLVFGRGNWQWLALLWMCVPLVSLCLFARAQIPALRTPESASSVLSLAHSKKLRICLLCIFLGGASECTMAQWGSSYLEQALGIPKVWGDIFGVAMFSVMLGLGRSLYAKYGGNIYKTLALSAAGAALCYLTAAFSSAPVVGLAACAMTGLCTAMLWPGNLIAAGEQFPEAGVAMFALMAAGGDLGGAIGPQLVGSVTDLVLASGGARALAAAWGMTAEQLAMKAGLTAASLFPLCAAVLFGLNYKAKRSGAQKV